MSSRCKLFISGAIVEVGISSDDNSGNKRKLGGSAATTTGDIADSKLRQKAIATSGTLQAPKSDQLANNNKKSSPQRRTELSAAKVNISSHPVDCRL